LVRTSICLPALAAVALLGLGLPSSCARSAPGDPVILELGDRQVRRSEFEAHLAQLERQGVVMEPTVRSSLLTAFLERRILVLEAQAQGLRRGADTPEAEQTAVQQLLDRAVGSKVQVSDDEIAAYFTEHQSEYAQPETITLRQILVPTDNQARDVKRRLQKDPKQFEALAQSHSRGPEAGQGGLMGVFSPGQLPAELETAAFALATGETSAVVSTPLGHHVLRVDARQPARSADLAECRDRIRARLTAAKSERLQREFVAGLLARAKVNNEAAQARTAPR
jgi:parvulin-like peptidyl-prolyl isomerase